MVSNDYFYLNAMMETYQESYFFSWFSWLYVDISFMQKQEKEDTQKYFSEEPGILK